MARPKEKKKKKKKKKREREEDIYGEDSAASAAEQATPKRLAGAGRLISSGTTVTGQGTRFMDELANGDAILIVHPTTLQEEVRIVKMVLSNSSISVSSEFSSDLITATRFDYIKKPRELEDPTKIAAEKKRRKDADDKTAFGTYAGSKTFTYRARKGTAYGGYTIITEKLDHEMSREELLDLRCKKKHDRHARS